MVGQGRESQKDNDLFYTCGLIEYIARKTKNIRSEVVKKLGKDRISKRVLFLKNNVEIIVIRIVADAAEGVEQNDKVLDAVDHQCDTQKHHHGLGTAKGVEQQKKACCRREDCRHEDAPPAGETPAAGI